MKQKLFAITLLVSTLSIHAKAENIQNINIYTYSSFANPKYGAGIKVKTLFEKQFPKCRVNYTAIHGTNAMFNRLRIEGKNSRADMVIGVNNFMVEEAVNSALFVPTKVDISHLPKEFQNKLLTPYGFANYAFVYDARKLKNPPQSLKDLVNNQKLRIIYADPRTSALGQGMLALINQSYPASEISSAWQKLNQHTVTITKGWTEAYGAFLKGEADLVLSYNTSPLYHQLNEQNFNYHATKFLPAIAQVEYLATLQGHQSQCTENFTQFMLTPQAQSIVAQANVMLPVIKTSINPAYDALYEQNIHKKTMVLTPKAIQIQNWINEWQQALSN